MDWYKMHHGTPYDPKIAGIARRAELSRAETLALWIALLDHASRNNPRGALDRLDPEEISAALDLPSPKITGALAAMRDRGMIAADNSLADWHHNQMKSTDRVRRHRSRAAEARKDKIRRQQEKPA